MIISAIQLLEMKLSKLENEFIIKKVMNIEQVSKDDSRPESIHLDVQ